MTTDRDDNLPPRIHRVDRPDGRPQAHEQARAGQYREADQLDRMDDQGQGSKRQQAKGRSDDRAHDDARGRGAS